MEDSTPNQASVLDNENTDASEMHNNVKAVIKSAGKHDALLPISVVGGLIGMLVGILPATIWVLIFGVSFSPLYIFLPLIIYLSIKIFKGYHGKRGVITTFIFTIIGTYLTLLSCQAALEVAKYYKYNMSFLSVPLVTITMIGKDNALPGPLLSASYILPVVFVILGALLAYELLMQAKVPAAIPEPTLNTEYI